MCGQVWGSGSDCVWGEDWTEGRAVTDEERLGVWLQTVRAACAGPAYARWFAAAVVFLPPSRLIYRCLSLPCSVSGSQAPSSMCKAQNLMMNTDIIDEFYQ